MRDRWDLNPQPRPCTYPIFS